MENIKKLLETIAILRSENGCDWDKIQTHKTLKSNMLEEAYEAVDAINSGNMEHLKEELGDVLLQVVLHSQIAKEKGDFTFEEVAKGINEKLIERHPHVFSDTKVENVEEILANWEEIKRKSKPDRKSILDGISKAQSALMTAQKISKKAVKVGFEWENINQLYECILSEFQEFINAKNKDEQEDEFGDILFALVNLARWKKLDAEQCLIRANAKFTKRFKFMEEHSHKPLKELDLNEWDILWKMAKKSVG